MEFKRWRGRILPVSIRLRGGASDLRLHATSRPKVASGDGADIARCLWGKPGVLRWDGIGLAGMV